MSASQSNLSAAQYGYDFVVAVTQASINATMHEYMSGLPSPEVIICYIQDDNGDAQLIDYQTLIKNAGGTDPFSVADGADPASQALQNLSDASFWYAFKAQIGLPPGYAPLTPGGQILPDIIVLGANTASVTYNLTCSEFTIVGATYGRKGFIKWLNQSQPSGNAWVFSSKVDLRLTKTDPSAYGKLPPDVQGAIKNLGGNAFSVQQLLFDLENAKLESVPTITGVAAGSDLYTCLQKEFLGAYFTNLQKLGQPVLGYAITQSTAPSSTLILTDLNMEVNPFIGTNGQPVSNPGPDQQDLATLCYLCAANGATLPVATQFSWNWIEEEDKSVHGIIAVNRNTFVKYLEGQLLPYFKKNCFFTNSTVKIGGPFTATVQTTNDPTITKTCPPTGATVLEFSYGCTSHDSAWALLGSHTMDLNTTFDLTVTFFENTIVFAQHLVFYSHVATGTDSAGGNIYDTTITDTFTLSVDQSGNLNSARSSVTVDASYDYKTCGFMNFITGLNGAMDQITQVVNLASVSFTDIPLNFAQDFIFPGGKTFTFESVTFSDNQDLTSHINYNQPQ